MAACKEGTMLVMCSTTDLKLRPKGLSILTGYTLGGTGGKFRSPLPDLFHSLSEKGFHGSVRQSAYMHALYNNHSQDMFSMSTVGNVECGWRLSIGEEQG